MERNHNEQQIVMSIEHYRNLLGMADRSQYTTKKIEKHVRKHNQFLQAPHVEHVREIERERSANIVATRKLVSKFAGKAMYAKAQIHLNSDQFDPVYVEVIVKRVSKQNRQLVVVIPKADIEYKYAREQAVSHTSLIEHLPDNYIPGVGSYERYMVLENSHYDIREALARREEYHNRNRKPKESDDECGDALAVAYDVIGER